VPAEPPPVVRDDESLDPGARSAVDALGERLQ
jgi:hypothetical protein